MMALSRQPHPGRVVPVPSAPYLSVQEMQGSTDAWMIDRSASGCPVTIASMAGMFTKDGVRIFTRAGVAPPYDAT